jgi:hypothetical protein
VIAAFDGAGVGDTPITGVGRAFLHGLAAYAARGDARCLLLLPAGAADPRLPGVEIVPAPRGACRRQLVLPRLLRRLCADVLHASVAAVPLRAPCPTVATAHDLPWLHAELGERTTTWRRCATTLALRSATAIVTPSAFTATDVRRLLGARCPPLHVVPHGVPLPDAEPNANATADDAMARSGPLLVLGDDRPRKNRVRLQAADAEARRTAPDLPPLRFVGPPHDFVDEPTKVQLLQTCRAVVHVAMFEGFGLPVLEGLAHGAPVLASDLPPHREIAGTAALFVDPRDPGAIAAGLVRIHRDAALRRQLAAAGRARAAMLQPQHTAAAWAAIHAEVRR